MNSKECPICDLVNSVSAQICDCGYNFQSGQRGQQPQSHSDTSRRQSRAMSEKSLPLAIGLNFLLPGIGYVYMGRAVIGVAAGLLILAIFATTGLIFIPPTWIGLNVIMAIDMVILFNKHKKVLAEATTMKCPQCAERIQREARICRFCQSKLV